MLIGAVIILFPKSGLSFHAGDWIILVASAFPPLGNYFQQKLRKEVSSETILFVRSCLSFPFFFLLAYLLRENLHFYFGAEERRGLDLFYRKASELNLAPQGAQFSAV